ncbi:unnamed protein product [Rotaria sp. Silwood1]|nr:unnamed protein product [Rotaria sp. Silwood1]CAF1613041.1 unnamed protein product [Rotaria sp. Silwood1]CAF3748125.1 unnamed protein product [Rotaria sp. Silwood1]CAF3799094.1 unnamed protein product [Rotaria sp. Silwood1]CAF4572963.1 unnamed protein product [Rotaria sp. Silwood1]
MSSPANIRELKLRKKLDEQKKSEIYFIKLLENKVRSLINQLELEVDEVTKLRQDLTKMAKYNQQLQTMLGEELDNRDRREQERKRILAISRWTPFYWGPNAFEEAYCEIEISSESPEFNTIEQLMNSTISKHGNRYGTVNERDPTEFLINRIVRI